MRGLVLANNLSIGEVKNMEFSTTPNVPELYFGVDFANIDKKDITAIKVRGGEFTAENTLCGKCGKFIDECICKPTVEEKMEIIQTVLRMAQVGIFQI